MSKWIFKKDCIVGTGGISVEYTYWYTMDKFFRVTASKHGVTLTDSPLFTENSHLQSFARALSDAFKDHRSLKRTGKPYAERVGDSGGGAEEAEPDAGGSDGSSEGSGSQGGGETDAEDSEPHGPDAA